MHELTCPTCRERWTCNCGRTPCLFEGKNCDDCELERLDAEHSVTLPTLDETFAAVERAEPAPVMDVLGELGVAWPQRGTIRNRLETLVDDGRIISDEQRPERFAVNHLEGAPR